MSTAADTMLGHLRAVKDRWAPDEPDRFGVVSVSSADGEEGYYELLQDQDPEIDLARTMCVVASRVVELPHLGWVPLTVTLDETEYRVDFALEGIDGPIHLRFDDGSQDTLPPPLEQPDELATHVSGSSSVAVTATVTATGTVTHSVDAVLVPLDEGPALLEPITVEEFGSIEILIGELYKAHVLDQIDAHQARKILELADLLKDIARETVPGETERWRPIGAIGAVLRKLFQAPFRDALALSQIVETVAEVKWADLAHQLQQLMS